MTYTDELTRAIRTKFAPDLMTALRDTDDPMGFTNPQNSVTLPLRADVRMLYQKDMAAFVLRGRVHNAERDEFECWEGLFASETLRKASDKAAAVEFLFEQVKRAFLRAIAEGELDHILRGKP